MSNPPALLERDAPARSPSVSLSGLLAAVHAAGLGLLSVTVLVLVGWATAADGGGSATQALGGALQVWVVGHGGELILPQGRFGVVPLGLMALPFALVFVSARRAARAAGVVTARDVLALTGVLTATYAVVAVVVAVLASGDPARPEWGSAFLGSAGLAFVAGGAGAVQGTGRSRRLWRRVPLRLRVTVLGAAGALATLLAGGSLVAALALARRHGSASMLADQLDTGLSGGLLLLLLGVIYVPTAVVWATAYVVGPGFAVGTGTSVTMAGVELGAVPAFPLLGALPPGPESGLGYAPLVVPLAAGVVGGLLVHRAAARAGTDLLGSWREAGRLGAATGAVTGLAFALLAALASGPGGPGRLHEVGPSAVWVGLTAAAEVAVVAIVTLCVLRSRRLG